VDQVKIICSAGPSSCANASEEKDQEKKTHAKKKIKQIVLPSADVLVFLDRHPFSIQDAPF
jgi:N-acetylmuramic acid 6-phosphate (MurNAc-6-P) etherase